MHPQSGVECLHGCVFFQLSKAGDGILADPTGHDARKMGQIGSDVDGKAVQLHPSAYAYANGADFGLTSIWSIAPATDASLGSPCSYAEFTESGNDPILPITNEVPVILAPCPHIDLDIAISLNTTV